MNALFRKTWNEHGQSVLTEQGYTLQEDFAVQTEQKVPIQVFLPYLKPLGDLGYAHIIVGYSANQRSKRQYFSVQVLRYDDRKPHEACLGPRIDCPRTYLAGYLPIPTNPPLPLFVSGSRTLMAWSFEHQEQLVQQILAVRERLAKTILPWLEDPSTTQYVKVKKEWYIQPFEHYLAGRIDAAQAYERVKDFRPEGYFIDVETVAEAELVSIVHTILRQHMLVPHLGQEIYQPVLLEYLLACLKGDKEFH